MLVPEPPLMGFVLNLAFAPESGPLTLKLESPFAAIGHVFTDPRLSFPRDVGAVSISLARDLHRFKEGPQHAVDHRGR